MGDRMRLNSVIAGALLAFLAAGCGANDELENEGATSLKSELVASGPGSFTERVSLSSPDWPASAWQSETAGAAKDRYEYVAYNAEDTDTTHVTYPQRAERDAMNRPYVDRIVCPGTSAVGRSTWSPVSFSWSVRRMPLPAGWAVLWGDPALALFDGNWWVSALASPSDYFATRANVTVGAKSCYRTSNFSGSGLPSGFGSSGTPLAGACVQGTSLKTIDAPNSVSCFRRSNGVASANGTDFLDGGSLAPCASAVYAAYADTKTDTVAMYRRPTGGVWAAVAGDSAIKTDNHPVLIEATNYTGIWMISSFGGAVTVRTHSAANGFGAPVSVGNDYSGADVKINGGAVIRRGRGLAGIVAPNPNALNPATWITYETETVSANGLVKKKALVVMKCTTACTFVTRIGGIDPLTGRGPNAFMPAMAFTYKLINNVPTPIIGLTYFTDSGQAANNVELRYYTFGINGVIRNGGALTAPQVACPGGGANYWGDYDSMYVTNPASTAPVFHRNFTDSTEAVCDTTTRANLDYRSQSQHVSSAYFAVP